MKKIINSVDAVLLREAYRNRVKPEGFGAPTTTPKALEEFFQIPEGKLTRLSSKRRSELGENIKLIATGTKSSPNYIIADLGEGQTPENMPTTFLSLNRSNKLRIPFVQGKFNMGGTGSLQFCGKHNFQLILTRRDPNSGPENNEWGFTIIRREDPEKGVRSSVFKYLRPDNQVLAFSSAALTILPGAYPNAYEEPMEYGSFIKLYEYDLKGGLKTNIQFDLYNRLSSLLPSIALPVTLYERRSGYRGHSFETILSGLVVRLEDDRSNNLEPGFPASSEIVVDGEKMKISIYVFKKGRRENYTGNDGVLFTYNGQTHGFINKAFFERKIVDMSYLSDSILVFVDCSDISGRAREDLFMNSRDRLRESPLLSGITEELAKILNSHAGLKALRESRRRNELHKNLEDSKPLAETLEKIIRQSPSLSSLFDIGTKVSSPFNLTETHAGGAFKGKKYPTYFKPGKRYADEILRPINHGFRLVFETDAENEYFIREENPGVLRATIDGEEPEDFSYNLWNGVANLGFNFPDKTQPGDKLEFVIRVDGDGQVEPFIHTLWVVAGEAVQYKSNGNGERKQPPSSENGQGREKPSALALPSITEVRKIDWEAHGFNEQSALEIKSFEGNYDFYINVDNVHLLNEIKLNPRVESEIIRTRFIDALVLASLALLNKYEQRQGSANTEDVGHLKQIEVVAEALAQIVCPMIDKLGAI